MGRYGVKKAGPGDAVPAVVPQGEGADQRVTVGDESPVGRQSRGPQPTEPAHNPFHHPLRRPAVQGLKGIAEKDGAVGRRGVSQADGRAVPTPEGRLGRKGGGEGITPVLKGIVEVVGPQAIPHQVASYPCSHSGGQSLSIGQDAQIVGGKVGEASGVQMILAAEEETAAILQIRRQARLFVRGEGLVPIVAGEPDHDRIPLEDLQGRAVIASAVYIPVVVGQAIGFQSCLVVSFLVVPAVVVHQEDRGWGLGGQEGGAGQRRR